MPGCVPAWRPKLPGPFTAVKNLADDFKSTPDEETTPQPLTPSPCHLLTPLPQTVRQTAASGNLEVALQRRIVRFPPHAPLQLVPRLIVTLAATTDGRVSDDRRNGRVPAQLPVGDTLWLPRHARVILVRRRLSTIARQRVVCGCLSTRVPVEQGNTGPQPACSERCPSCGNVRTGIPPLPNRAERPPETSRQERAKRTAERSAAGTRRTVKHAFPVDGRLLHVAGQRQFATDGQQHVTVMRTHA